MIEQLYILLSTIPMFVVSMIYVIMVYTFGILSLKSDDIIKSCGLDNTGKLVRNVSCTLTCICATTIFLFCMIYYDKKGNQCLLFFVSVIGIGLIAVFIDLFISDLNPFRKKQDLL